MIYTSFFSLQLKQFTIKDCEYLLFELNSHKKADGYTNRDRFRNRLLYVLDKDVTYLLYPLPKEGVNIP